MTGHRTSSPFYLIAVLVSLALVGVGWWLYRTKAYELRAVEHEYATKAEELASLTFKIAQLPRMQEELEQLQTRLAILEPALPTAAYVPTFLQQIERMAEDTGNVMDGIRPRPAHLRRTPQPATNSGEAAAQDQAARDLERARDYYDVLPLQIALIGDYHSFQRFLQRLTEFPKMIAINDVTARPLLQVQYHKTPELHLQLEAVALVLKPIPLFDLREDSAPRPESHTRVTPRQGARHTAHTATDAEGT